MATRSQSSPGGRTFSSGTRANGSGAAKLAAILAGESPANRRSSGHCCSHIQRQEGRPTCRKPGSKSPLGPGRPGLIRHRRASKPTGRSVSESGSPEIRALRETDCRNYGSAELFRSWRRPCSASENWTMTMTKLPGVIEGGMSGKNGQRKLGTTRGSPRRSRTAKASRISRQAAKSRCACEWGAWGRLSEDGSGQHNPNPSEDPWGGGRPILHGGALASGRPDTVRDYRRHVAMHEGRRQTERTSVYVGSRLKLTDGSGRHRPKAGLSAVLGKTRRTE